SLVVQQPPQPEREAQLAELADRYGLSNALAEQAIRSLELSRGDSRAAYELLAQWSLSAQREPRRRLPPSESRRFRASDEQATHKGELVAETLAWKEVEAALDDDAPCASTGNAAAQSAAAQSAALET